jgi:hypothetical protein
MNPSSLFGKLAGGIACFIAAGLCLGASNVAKADSIAYMSANAGGNPEFESVFGTIDLNTGMFSLLGPTAIGGNLAFQEPLSGMAEANGTLYGAAEGINDNGQLYTINPANGTLTRVGATGLSIANLGSTTTGLFVVDSSLNLYSINPATGAPTLIGATGAGNFGFSALSTNANSLYFADGNSFYTLNTSTGAATLVGLLGGTFPGETQLTGLLQENGTLYGASEVFSPSLSLDTVDPTTGAATIGPDITGAGVTFVTGFAPFPVQAVPAPLIGHGLAVVLAVGGVLFGSKLLQRSRKRRSFGTAIRHAAV